ncbi:MAG: 23S rRNA (adenine(1618)-N(6))-methyltransferase RlmF [Bacteriovoracaceae bacterium]|nr:23S rRNA (adenine(1618)-N(6))-methyltransferase RlmF [Bacteriovoracaceae bacterium]
MKVDKGLHPRNIHNAPYEFDTLVDHHPDLSPYVKKNDHGSKSVDFFNPSAVFVLNQALLSFHYKVNNWSIPKGKLCPGVPGRADYLHYLADLLAESNEGTIPVGTKVKGLDIGTGSSCIYPILGNCIYGWRFVGTDINPESLNNAKTILKDNSTLNKNIKTRFQKSADSIFKDILKNDEFFDFTMCNPPFNLSLEEAKAANDNKLKGLAKNKGLKGAQKKGSNFGGKDAELYCPGGERSFVSKMISESEEVKNQCRWFTSLISKKENLDFFQEQLKSLGVSKIHTIEMHHGNKIAHILAWQF